MEATKLKFDKITFGNWIITQVNDEQIEIINTDMKNKSQKIILLSGSNGWFVRKDYKGNEKTIFPLRIYEEKISKIDDESELI